MQLIFDKRLKSCVWLTPNFHIARRVGTKDRMVMIARANDTRLGIHLIGVNGVFFHHAPICFTLALNQLYFTSISADFLLARRMGFPYPARFEVGPSAPVMVELEPGRGRITHPVLNLPLKQFGPQIFQPLFSRNADLSRHPLYETEYVRASSLDFDAGVGWPFVATSGPVEKYPAEASMKWYPREAHERYGLHAAVIEETLRSQMAVWDYVYCTEDKAMKSQRTRMRLENKKLLAIGGAKLSTLR